MAATKVAAAEAIDGGGNVANSVLPQDVFHSDGRVKQSMLHNEAPSKKKKLSYKMKAMMSYKKLSYKSQKAKASSNRNGSDNNGTILCENYYGGIDLSKATINPA